MKPIVDPAWIADAGNRKNITIIDARSGAGARLHYEQKHLEGSLHVDLEKDLSGIRGDAADGGRHPLPSPQDFGALLQRLGIQPDSHVVVYDDKNGANAAARFWWMLKAAGHEKAQVIDGGFQAAVAAGVPVSKGSERSREAGFYPVGSWNRPTVSIDEVAEAGRSHDRMVIDVREGYRYRGESEPIDPVAGHIPGAINVPYLTNLDQNGRFLSADELTLKYRDVLAGKAPADVFVHCGSGVTACHTLLALEQAGLAGAKLYVGSWSEWCRNDRPVATEENGK